MKLSYEYKLKKIAFLFDGKEQIPVGEFEQDSRDGDTIKMTVKLFKHIPKELIALLQENPQVLTLREVKEKAHMVVHLPEGSDLIV